MEIDNYSKKLIEKYWSKQRCGKHDSFARQHTQLLATSLKVNVSDLFEQIYENNFKFTTFKKTSWSDLLKIAKLEEYLDKNYITDALEVTSSEPAIGKGEFLFVSCFSNLGFAADSGDIVDLNNGIKCEFKGMRSTLSGYNKTAKQMNKSLMFSIYSILGKGLSYDHFNRECAHEIDEILKKQPDKINKVLMLLQNYNTTNDKAIAAFSELYYTKPDLFNIVGAMQLVLYMTYQNASYMLMTNDAGFCCFAKPETPIDAYRIITNLKLSSWYTGDSGMTIGI